MINVTKKVNEVVGCVPNAIPDEVLHSTEPILLKGLVKDWPLVQAALRSDEEVDQYLRKFYKGYPVTVSTNIPENRGRYFYNEDFSQLNFSTHTATLDTVLDRIFEHKHDELPPSIYVGSTTLDSCLPGLSDENNLNMGDLNPLVSIWIGNQTRVPAHYDAPENIACVVIGKRRFTLFPPDQIDNLYPGPLDFTPAGQVVSIIDFHNPDFEKFPRFKAALEHALVADMEPGDALLIPTMWWHHVEGLSSFNMLINYWWRLAPKYMGQAVNVLNHAILSIRDLPEHEKAAWKHIFDYYIFGDAKHAGEHLPKSARGSLGELDEMQARKLRALLLNKLNR